MPDLSCTTVVVHNRDQAEIFQNTLIERTPKAAFRALDLFLKHSRPFFCVYNTSQQVLKVREMVLGVF